MFNLLTKSVNFRNAGDLQKYNRENADFVASSKFTYLENLYVYGIKYRAGL